LVVAHSAHSAPVLAYTLNIVLLVAGYLVVLKVHPKVQAVHGSVAAEHIHNPLVLAAVVAYTDLTDFAQVVLAAADTRSKMARMGFDLEVLTMRWVGDTRVVAAVAVPEAHIRNLAAHLVARRTDDCRPVSHSVQLPVPADQSFEVLLQAHVVGVRRDLVLVSAWESVVGGAHLVAP
jgi:hypothetical protein